MYRTLAPASPIHGLCSNLPCTGPQPWPLPYRVPAPSWACSNLFNLLNLDPTVKGTQTCSKFITLLPILLASGYLFVSHSSAIFVIQSIFLAIHVFFCNSPFLSFSNSFLFPPFPLVSVNFQN